MAFTPDDLNFVLGAVGGGSFSIYFYETDDILEDIVVDGYFHNVARFGVGAGDTIEVYSTADDGHGTFTVTAVNSITGTATVVLAAVDASTIPAVPVTVPGSLTARSIRDRFGDIINILDYGGDATNSSSVNGAAFIAAHAAALTKSKACIFYPEGRFRHETGTTLTISRSDITVLGCGTGATTMAFENNGGNWIQIGTASADTNDNTNGVLSNVNLRDFEMIGSGVHTSGYAISAVNLKQYRFDNLMISGARQALGLGDGALKGSDMRWGWITNLHLNCSGNVNTHQLGQVDLESGSVLFCSNWYANGTSTTNTRLQYLFNQKNTTYNWDGIEVIGLTGADFSEYVRIVGKGLGNMLYYGGVIDDFDVAYRFQPTAAGHCQHNIIMGVRLPANGDGPSGNPALGLIATPSSGVNVWDLTVDNCSWFNLGDHCVQLDANIEMATIVNNRMENCGNDATGTSLIKFGAASGVVANNGGWCSSGQAFTYLVEWANGAIGPPVRQGPNATAGSDLGNWQKGGLNAALFTGTI